MRARSTAKKSTAEIEQDAAAVAQMVAWGEDPQAFVLDSFGPGYEAQNNKPLEIDDWQDEFLALLPTAMQIALAACKGVGKSCGEAWAIWWFLATRHDAEVICCSITADNLKTGLWKELAVWYSYSPLLQRMFEFGKTAITHRERPDSWWCFARSFPKDADTTQQANTLAGLHGPCVMFVGDEAGDFPDGVVTAAEGILANDVEARIILGGNTTRTAGPLYRAALNRQGRYRVIRITGDPDDPRRCKRVSLDYARAMIAEHGRDHPWVKINILGEFPDIQSDKLVGPDDIARAQRRDYQKADIVHEPVIIGIDTARQGDDLTALCRRQGPVCFQLKTWRVADTMVLADQIAGVLIQLNPLPDAIFVDTGGPSGFAILDRLKQLGFQNVVGIDFGTDPVGDEVTAPLFGNRRAEMHYKAAKWVQQRGSLPSDIELGVELCEPTYSVEAKGKQTRFWVEPKDEIKKRLGRSPDRADAFVLTFAAPVVPRAVRELQQQVQAQRQQQANFDPFAVLGGRA